MDESLMREAGFGGGFVFHKNLKIDNGSDIAGTGATGHFIEVSYDQATKQKVKKSFGVELKGVILLSRAVITYTDRNTRKKVWESEEFNPLLNKKRDGAQALIPIYQLDFNGKRQKSPDGKFIVEYAFYEDLSEQKKANVKGFDFTYTIVLYVLIAGNKVVKLKFKGKSRGNFFDYQKNLWKDSRMKTLEVYTKISSYFEDSYSKFAINFTPILGQDGQPRRYENTEILEKELRALLESQRTKLLNLPTPQPGTPIGLLSQTPKEPQPMPTGVALDDIPVIEDEVEMEDIPF